MPGIKMHFDHFSGWVGSGTVVDHPHNTEFAVLIAFPIAK